MQTDADFLGITAADAGRSRFTVIERLSRLDGRLYGGAAIAVSIAEAERVTQRPAVWVTTQFVSTVEGGEEVDVLTEVLAVGRRTCQVRVTASSQSGEVIFASLGATGSQRSDGLTGVFEKCPTVSPPSDAEPWRNPFSGLAKAAGLDHLELPLRKAGFSLAVEMREATVLQHPEPGPGRMCLWVRRSDRVNITPAVAGYLADMVPMSVGHALGVVAGGTSLDNTIRIGSFVDTEWILLDLRPHLAAGGYAHGVVHVWSEDGHLLATASQTASMIEFDPSHIPGLAGTSEGPPT
ncbi:MAG: acyl-CoA thioesterase [Acidimicrobiales bacterium]